VAELEQTNKQIKKLYKNFVKDLYDEDGVLTEFSLCCMDNYNFGYDVVDKIAELEPNRKALVWTDAKGNERIFSYKELSDLSNKAANLFSSRGIKKGDMVMLVLKRNYQFWLAIIGLIKLGAVVIPATHLLTEKDFAYRFEQSGVKTIVVTGDSPEVIGYADKGNKAAGNVLENKFAAKVNGQKLPEGWADFDAELEKQSADFPRADTNCYEPMILYFTSGTSGYPKMVIHNHRYALAHVQTAIWQNIQSDGLHLTIADTGWGKAVWGKLFGQMTFGAAVFVYDFDRFVPSELLNMFAKYKITSFCAPPTMFNFFIKDGLEKYDLSSLKYCVVAGEALSPEVFDRWLEFTGIKLMEGFGQTETTILLCNFSGMMPKPGSMGKPAPLYDVRLVDNEGAEVPPGEIGTIVVFGEKNSDGLFGGYYKNEELTNEVWRKDPNGRNYYSTGDNAWKDEDGYYWYSGRNDDIIKSSGYRIGPFEVESVLMTHPAVMECAVTGVPDPVRGFAVKATIVLMKDYLDKDTEELKKELQNHVKKNTAPYKYPRVIEFTEKLPKTISGKIRRTEIRAADNK
jgi:acetyl-CoA synthetase